MISTIYIKPSSTRNNQNISNLTIKLKNTTLTTLSSGSWVSGMTTCYGPSTITTSTSSGSWKAFTLSAPFYYTGGNLILEISHTGSSAGISINQFNVTGRNGRKYGSTSSSSSTGVDRGTALFGFDGYPAACSGTPGMPNITTASLTTANPICSGSTKSLSAFDPNAPLTNLSYSWQHSNSSTGPWTNVSSGSGSTTLNYTTGALTSSIWFRFGVKCNVSNITTYSSPYLVRVGAAQPGNIAGRSSSCNGDTATYSVAGIPGHSYAWTLPSGWTGSSTSNIIHVVMNGTGTISVIATGCGGTSVARTKNILAGTAPLAPISISGKINVCAGTVQGYKVPKVATAQSYTWTLPSGWSGSSATDSISVLAGTAGGSILVKANNGCGSSANQSKAIAVISALANPGTITSSAGTGPYCSGQLYSFSINPVLGATYYIWTLPSGWTGTNTGTSIQTYAGNSGQISVKAYVACAISPASTLSTTVNSSVNPGVTLSPNSIPICKNQITTFTASPVNGGSSPYYRWRKNGSLLIASGSTYSSSNLSNSDVISVEMISNAACRTADTVSSSGYNVSLTPSVTPGISINSNPVVKICAGTPLTFITKINGRGPNPDYQWYKNGVAISSADDTSFTPAAIADGDSFHVELNSDAVCATDTLVESNHVRVEVDAAVSPTLSISASTTNALEPVTFTIAQSGGGSNPVYQWILNSIEIPGATNSSYSNPGLRSGDRVSVRMQSSELCANPSLLYSDEIVMGSPAGIANQQGWQGTLGLFPNPNSGQFTLAATWPASYVSKPLRIELFNILGQPVFEKEIQPLTPSWEYPISLPELLPSGQYLLRITTQDGMSARLQLLLQR
ncbi:MAG: T9SS type A sorting domain-containing protein [Bacteroidetes bacterium]|nr:T9SS type A sorting domain-containing protein [Bacteroidota bacterium]